MAETLIHGSQIQPGTLPAAALSSSDVTDAGRALLDDADFAAMRTTLGLGSAAVEDAAAFEAAGASAAAVAAHLGAADPHTQYALLAGRAGGQTVIGGTGSGDPLTFQSTSHGTKGPISIGDGSSGSVVANTPTVVLGSGDGGTPLAISLRGAAAAGSNVAGANITVDAQNGTGTGGSGALIFRTAPVGASGSTANTLTERVRLTKEGYLGINTGANAAVRLHVLGTGNLLRLAQSTTSYMTFTQRDNGVFGWLMAPGGNYAETFNFNTGNISIGGDQPSADHQFVVYGKTQIIAGGTTDADATAYLLVRPSIATEKAIIAKGVASQSANLQEWQDSAGGIHSTVSENGYFTTRKNSAPADAELATGEVAIWFDSTAGSAAVNFKGKNASGTVVTASVALS